MKKVRCISPHGGCHNGATQDSSGGIHPVYALRDGTLPAIDPAKLVASPNPGGYIDCPALRVGPFAAVGQVYDVPDEFVADGFHFEDVKPSPPPPASAAPAAPAEGK